MYCGFIQRLLDTSSPNPGNYPNSGRSTRFSDYPFQITCDLNCGGLTCELINHISKVGVNLPQRPGDKGVGALNHETRLPVSWLCTLSPYSGIERYLQLAHGNFALHNSANRRAMQPKSLFR